MSTNTNDKLYTTPQPAIAQPEVTALQQALNFIQATPHGDNCFLHNDGGEYDSCFCGKTSVVNLLEGEIESTNLQAAIAAASAVVAVQPKKPFPAPGRWFPVGVLGHPMREYEPGKWEFATWPSEAVQGEVTDPVEQNRCIRELKTFSAANPGTWIFPGWDGNRVTKYLAVTSTKPAEDYPHTPFVDNNGMIEAGDLDATPQPAPALENIFDFTMRLREFIEGGASNSDIIDLLVKQSAPPLQDAEQAKRYRFIADPCSGAESVIFYGRGDYGRGLLSGPMLDEAIDTAIARKNGEV